MKTHRMLRILSPEGVPPGGGTPPLLYQRLIISDPPPKKRMARSPLCNNRPFFWGGVQKSSFLGFFRFFDKIVKNDNFCHYKNLMTDKIFYHDEKKFYC